MYKIDTNDKAFKELNDYAISVKQPLKDVLLSDAHLEQVTRIFYPHLPKPLKFVMKLDKFKEYYKEHREKLVKHMII
jgi:hypothetical protein